MKRFPVIVAAACMPALLPAQDPGLAEPGDTKHGAVTAAPKTAGTDTVTLTSGNRMSGTVNGLLRGRLLFEIDGIGDVLIDWNNVAALSSTRIIVVEIPSGTRLIGLVSSSSADSITVRTEAGPRTIAKRDAIRMTPIAATVRDRTTGSVDVGFALLNANDEFDLTLNGDAENRTGPYVTNLSVSLLVRRLNDQTAQSRNRLDLRSRKFLPDRWFGLGLLELEQNRFLDLNLRMLAGVAPGRMLLQTNRAIVSVYAGVDYLLADYRGVEERKSHAEALAAFEWDWFEIGGATQVSLLATGFVGLGEGGARSDVVGRLRRDFLADFYWSLNLFHEYNNEPPPGLRTTDYGFGLSIGRSF